MYVLYGIITRTMASGRWGHTVDVIPSDAVRYIRSQLLLLQGPHPSRLGSRYPHLRLFTGDREQAPLFSNPAETPFTIARGGGGRRDGESVQLLQTCALWHYVRLLSNEPSSDKTHHSTLVLF